MSLFYYQDVCVFLCFLLLGTLLFSHLWALWIWSEKAEGYNFHYYFPFVKEPFPLSDHPKQIESCIGLKSSVHRLKDTHTFSVVLSVCAHILLACVSCPQACVKFWETKKVGELAALTDTVLQLSLHRLSSSRSFDCKTYLSASSRNGQVKRPPKSVSLMLYILQTILWKASWCFLSVWKMRENYTHLSCTGHWSFMDSLCSLYLFSEGQNSLSETEANSRFLSTGRHLITWNMLVLEAQKRKQKMCITFLLNRLLLEKECARAGCFLHYSLPRIYQESPSKPSDLLCDFVL